MDLKTYQAYTMAEALAAVKRDLGADAVILNTRTYRRGGVMGIGRRTIIEVTAARNDPSRHGAGTRTRERAASEQGAARSAAAVETKPGKPAKAAVPAAAVRAYDASAASAVDSVVGDSVVGDSVVGGSSPGGSVSGGSVSGGSPLQGVEEPVASDNPELERLKTRRLALAMLERHERRQRAAAEAGAAGAAVGRGEGRPAQPVEVLAPESRCDVSSRPSVQVQAGVPLPGPSQPDSSQPGPSRAAHASQPPVPEGDARVLVAPTGAEVEPQRSAARVARRFLLTNPRAEQPRPADIGAPPVADVPVRADAASAPPAVESAPEPRPPMPVRLFEPPHTVTPPRAHDAVRSETDLMKDELSAIRTMVGQVLQRQTVEPGGVPAPAMPQALFDQYLALIGQELSTELADRIVNEVRADLRPDALDDPAAVRSAVRHRLAAYIPTAEHPVPESSPDGRPLTIALVGPTGVGKTTTLAKLAASFKLRHGRTVGLITSDTYRIAAVDQLRTYANIIGLRLEVVLTPSDMRQAVQSLSDCDVILIDTAGRSQNDADRIGDLRAFLDAAEAHEVHLVLSSTASEKVLIQEADAFGTVGVQKVVLTKLDEAVSFGVLVNVVRRIGKELSFFTTGQEVPDHIEVGQAERLAELVLGSGLRERVTT